MYENITYDTLLTKALSYAPKDIDTREGSLFFDAISGVCLLLAQYYQDLSEVIKQSSILTATGSYLDSLGANVGMERKTATFALYAFQKESSDMEISTEETYYSGGYGFKIIYYDGKELLQSVSAGSDYNNIARGTKVYSYTGNIILTITGLFIGAGDDEADDDYRKRIFSKLSEPVVSGNIQQYVNWCEEYAGVERAIVRVNLLSSPTRKSITAYLFDGEYNPVDDTIRTKVQAKIDPNKDGSGWGVAPVGATFQAVKMTMLPIIIQCTMISADLETAHLELNKRIEEYKNQEYDRIKTANMIKIRYNRILSIIDDLLQEGYITSYSDVLIGRDTQSLADKDIEVVLGNYPSFSYTTPSEE